MFGDIAPGLKISASGLRAEQTRLEIAAHNLSNVNTTRDIDGGPYKRRIAIFDSIMTNALGGKKDDGLHGVEVSDVVTDTSKPIPKYQPWHPDAGEDGYVDMPNISPMLEMLEVMTATRSYEANLNAIRQGKQMFQGTIDLLK